MFRALRKIQVKDPVLSRVQDGIGDVLNQVTHSEIIDGVLLKAKAIGMGATTIEHGLGRAPLGFIITGKNGPGDIYQSASPDSRILTLQATVAVTADIWVF